MLISGDIDELMEYKVYDGCPLVELKLKITVTPKEASNILSIAKNRTITLQVIDKL